MPAQAAALPARQGSVSLAQSNRSTIASKHSTTLLREQQRGMQRAAFAPDAGALDAVVRTRRSRIRSRRQPQSHIATACKCALVWKGVERRCALLAQSRAAPDRTSEEYMGSSFTAAERSLIAELSQVILPATDTPGAIEAGVPAFLEKIVFEWYSPGERRLFLAGLRELGEESSKRYKCDFAHCSSEQKQLLVRQLE